jgi:acetamidase/formamidase
MKILPTPETVHWGFFDAGLQPVATIDSGDTVTISTVSGGRDDMPPDGFDVPQALRDIQAAGLQPDAPGHICTGPVAINGAEPGDVLEVKIEAIDLSYGWGYTFFRPGSGALPDDFPARETFHSKLDKERMIATLPWGQELPLAPFFGVMAVAPTADQGRISTIPPRVNGGNMDNKELVAGTTLYLPVQVPGALFSAGDGHGCQGDGEVCVTAIETGLVGTFKLTVRKDMTLDAPQAESHAIARKRRQSAAWRMCLAAPCAKDLVADQAPKIRFMPAVDKGLIIESSVCCPDGSFAMISYSKVGAMYCWKTIV